MLWHNFTSSPKSDSEKFLSIVRLNLYIKKNLRPILERYIEEPNNWVTWKNIYLEGRVIMDDETQNTQASVYLHITQQVNNLVVATFVDTTSIYNNVKAGNSI